MIRDQPLAVLEAKKMQHELRAPLAGAVRMIAVTVEAQVAADDVLFEIEPEADASA